MSGARRRASCARSQRAREPRPERLRAVLRREVRLELRALEDEPRAEAADVAVDEPRAVVELEHGALVRHGLPVEATGHAEMDEEAEAALEPEQQVLAATLDREDAIALELLRDLEEVVRPREPRVEDLDARERAALEPRRELRPDGLHLRELGHGSVAPSRRRRSAAAGARHPRARP